VYMDTHTQLFHDCDSVLLPFSLMYESISCVYFNPYFPPHAVRVSWTPDDEIVHELYHPQIFLSEELYRCVHCLYLHSTLDIRPHSDYPAHLHIDLIGRAQGAGNGTRMMSVLLAALRERGVSGVHLEMSAVNHRAKAFYLKLGFSILPGPADRTDVLILGLKL
jgi:GNAT superfamily N-acetyltransferase